MRSEVRIIKSYGAVVFLDLLGIKGAWHNPATIVKTLAYFDDMYDMVKVIADDAPNNEPWAKHGLTIKQYSFSDTFVITATIKDTEFFEILHHMAGMLSVLLPILFSRGLYFRGCISFGEFYTSGERRMLIGPAIDEAVQYYNLPEWVGVSLAPSAHAAVINGYKPRKYSKYAFETYDFLPYNIPLKGVTETDGIAINWVRNLTNRELKILRNRFTDELHKANYDVGVALKYRNTLNFIEYALKNSPRSKTTPEKNKKHRKK